MRYLSQFNVDDTELYLQYIEGLRKFFSASAHFLLEEVEGKELPTVKLMVKEGDKLYKIESGAPDFARAVKNACEAVLDLHLKEDPKKEETIDSTQLVCH